MQVTIYYGNQNMGSYDLERFQKEVVSFGRQPDNDIVLNYDFVSRIHGAFFVENGSWYAQDLESSNGLLMNEKKIQGAHAIQSGDVLDIMADPSQPSIRIVVNCQQGDVQKARNLKKIKKKNVQSVSTTRKVIEWIVAIVLILFIVVGAGVPAYINHNYGGDNLKQYLVGTAFQVEDANGHMIDVRIKDVEQITSIKADADNLEWTGFFRYEYTAKANVDIGTGILENISVDITVPFMGWKTEAEWSYNLETVDDYGNEREVSDVGFDFVQEPHVTVGEIMQHLGVMGSYEVMIASDNCISQNYDAIEYAVIYREIGFNYSEPREDWVRIEYNYETKEWEWTYPVVKDAEAELSVALTELSFDNGNFLAQEEYTADYEIGIAVSLLPVVE